MESLDLHPEELFDKAARGAASAEELARIDAHLKSCAACRFERQVRADFDAVTGSADDVDDLVARALSGVAAEKDSGPPRRARRVAPLLAAAIALFGVASLAAVAQFTGLLPHLVERITASGDRTPEPAKKPSTPPSPPPAERVGERGNQELEAPALEPTPTVAVIPEPAPKKHVPSAARTAPVAIAPTPTPTPEPDATPEIPAVVQPEPVQPSVVAEPDALTLFSRAHRERVQGETASAIRDFRMVIARYPAAREAALAIAALGRLLLDRGEATSALEAFDAYLTSADTVLREDVLAGRATALEKLGRTTAERSAWEALLRDYPSSVYAPRARTRLESLAP
jgi:TolA-binding protein